MSLVAHGPLGFTKKSNLKNGGGEGGLRVGEWGA